MTEWSEAIIQNARFVSPEGASADPSGEQTKPRGLAEDEERRAEMGAPHAENEASEQHNPPTARAGRKHQRPRQAVQNEHFVSPSCGGVGGVAA
jgi:hypothetical protein